MFKGYLGRVLIAIDQAFNVIVLNGYPDETASSRWGRERKLKHRTAEVACEVLDAIQANHCGMSIEENPDGSTNSHHLGHSIHEIPRDPKDRLHKLRTAGL